jgi:hypothetical protein
MPHSALRLILVLGLSCIAVSARASSIVVDFESFTEGDAITNQIPGLTFTNATVITAGNGLNEFENPPHSGANVVFEDGGEISIAFSTPVSDFAGYFTYSLTAPATLTLTAFDSSHVALGASTQSAFSNNQGQSGEAGSSPNEFLQLLFSNISSVTITGELGGGSFTLDDVTFLQGETVPEPASLTLVLVGGAVAYARSRRRR